MNAPRKKPIAAEAAPAEAEKSSESVTKKRKWRPKKRHRMAAKRGQAPSNGYSPCLLNDELEEQICKYLELGASLVDASILVGVNPSSVSEWRAHGSQDLRSRFGQFYRQTEEARTRWKVRGIARMSRSDDLKHTWRLLCSRYPTEFRNYFSAELTGAEGTPLVASAFQVSITLTSAEEQQSGSKFTVRELEKAGGNGDGRP